MSAGANMIFRGAHAVGAHAQSVADTLAERLDYAGDGTGLGFLYVNEQIGPDAHRVLARVRAATGVTDWVGAVGFGVCATGNEFFGEPAAAALIAPFARDDYRLFGTVAHDAPDALPAEAGAFALDNGPAIGIVHADATNRAIAEIVAGISEQSGAYLVGGLTALGHGTQIAGDVTDGGASGVFLSSRVAAVTGLSQGCTPVGAPHVITDGRDNVLVELDRRPALDVLIEDIGPELAGDLGHAAYLIHAALPIPGSDQADYLVRNLVGIDPNQGCIAIGETIDTGQSLTFCIRDGASAEKDLRRMAANARDRLSGPPRAGLYFSCVARGPNMFGPGAREMGLLAEELGDIPIAGFYANGEISHYRLYGYTGVLLLFA